MKAKIGEMMMKRRVMMMMMTTKMMMMMKISYALFRMGTMTLYSTKHSASIEKMI